MRTVNRGLIGIISVVFFLGGGAMVTPLGSEAEASGFFKKHKRVGHKDLAKDHKKLGEWIEKVERQLEDLQGGVGGEGNHTLRWDTVQPAGTRFVVLADFGAAAVLDKETGLVWEQSPDTTLRVWEDKNSVPVDARRHCLRRGTGGRMGWRLPSIPELTSLVVPGNPAGGPDLPAGHPFSNVQSSFYWSATTNVAFPTFAWNVRFTDGNVSIFTKPNRLFVWCVRGGMNADAY